MKKNFLILLLLTTTTCLFADGKMYWKLETVNPEIPCQRALILHKDNTETLFLQSKYSIPETDEELTDLGWVVPLPSVPELASMDAYDASDKFLSLNFYSRPDYTRIRNIAIAYIVAILLLLHTTSIVFCLILYLIAGLINDDLINKHKDMLISYPLLSLLLYINYSGLYSCLK